MKKVYKKPEIMFEDFTLSTNIAGDCEKKTNTQNSGTCAYTVATKYGSWEVFTDAVSACTTKESTLDGVADGVYNSICYHVPYGENLFNS